MARKATDAANIPAVGPGSTAIGASLGLPSGGRGGRSGGRTGRGRGTRRDSPEPLRPGRVQSVGHGPQRPLGFGAVVLLDAPDGTLVDRPARGRVEA
jgi:hypothetical protein